ncbi:MAG: YesL family protein [Lachnospiraceae bacterium]|nr:YesL family protein [Lachnospiraceae bacterium]
MRRIFSLDGPLMSALSKFADIVLLNILFIICSLPIITIGASTTALYYVTLKMVKDEESYIFKNFFKSFVMNLKQATAIWMFILVVSGILVADFMIMSGQLGDFQGLPELVSKAMNVIFMMVLVAITFIATYAFPLLAKFDNTTKNTIKNALLMSIRHFPYSILMIVINVLPIVLIYFFLPAFIIIVFIFALSAFICSHFFVKIFVLYLPKEEEIKDDEDFNISQHEDSFLFESNVVESEGDD